jgi:hypothetical protein
VRTRAHLTYANVVATLALFLALTGGAVWAANKITSKQLGKGAVKTKNLAKNAVKKKNLAKNSVVTAKLAKGAVKNAKVADSAIDFAKLAAGTNVVASATGGPFPLQEGPAPLALSNPVVVTPVAGQLLTANIEIRGTLIGSGAPGDCQVFVLPIVNGTSLLIGLMLQLVSPPESPEPLFPNGISRGTVAFPLGLTEPGTPVTVGLSMFAETGDCEPQSRVDQVSLVITRVK